MAPHPLEPLSKAEFERARDTIINLHGPDVGLFFRAIYLEEPRKAEIVPFLQAEHAGTITDGATVRPPRLARLQYDAVGPNRGESVYSQSIVDVARGAEVRRYTARPGQETSYSPEEFGKVQAACMKSDLFKEAMSEFILPENFEVTMDPWPYGPPDDEKDKVPRLVQGLVYARDASLKNPDANHYAYPIPIIPVLDNATKEVIRIDRLATGGGASDGMEEASPRTKKEPKPKPKPLFLHPKHADYVPELIDRPLRTDLKPINITQPEGASFTVHPDNLVEWQNWRFRLGFTPREGPVLHDLCYDHRPVLFRLSYSELTVPYSDARAPFHRKQAFDGGDGGFGRVANNLQLGCDCLGAIHYFDALLTDGAGQPTPAKSVVCLHEQDNGIGWKHTNYRTDRAVVTRLRELVVQSVVTLANYEYVLAYKLDIAGGITVETRATGVVSVVAIDEEGKTLSPYGTVVAPGTLAQNHQHIFALRIDPAIDSYAEGDTRVAIEETVPVEMNPDTNPYGNYFENRKRIVERAGWYDAEPKLNRSLRFEHATKKNEVSGRNVGFKLIPAATQLILADKNSIQAKRAKYAQHHVWVTGYRDEELWAAGEYTNQSREEDGGVADMVSRGDWFVEGAVGAAGAGESNGGGKGAAATMSEGEGEGESEDENDAKGRLSTPVVWSVFGLTHNPRVEDWPVMPVEIHHLNIRPVDFFTSNPALDVPGSKNQSSVIVACHGGGGKKEQASANNGEGESTVQKDPATHLQGPGSGVNAADAGAHVVGGQ